MSDNNRYAQTAPSEALELLKYWRGVGEDRWFNATPDLDSDFRRRFMVLFQQCVAGDLAHWMNSAEGALATVILLDQFPRNAFRGQPRAFKYDARALEAAEAAIAAGFDTRVDPELRGFFYMPHHHSEDLEMQDRSVALQEALSLEWRKPASRHRDVIRKFGRFPHRNSIVGRVSTPEEEAYLKEGGTKS